MCVPREGGRRGGSLPPPPFPSTPDPAPPPPAPSLTQTHTHGLGGAHRLARACLAARVCEPRHTAVARPRRVQPRRRSGCPARIRVTYGAGLTMGTGMRSCRARASTAQTSTASHAAPADRSPIAQCRHVAHRAVPTRRPSRSADTSPIAQCRHVAHRTSYIADVSLITVSRIRHGAPADSPPPPYPSI